MMNGTSKCFALSQNFSVSSLHSLDLNLLVTSNTADQLDRRISSILHLKLYRLRIISGRRHVMHHSSILVGPPSS